MRPLSTELVLLEPFGVLPGSDFVKWSRVREDDKGIELFCCWEMLGWPLR